MRVITAPEDYRLQDGEVSVFLAGGITNCPNWQNDLIEYINSKHDVDDLVLFNPRRENFPIGDASAAQAQIEWEFRYLEKANIFSMFFSSGNSDQPICMYELGRNIVRMQNKFPTDWSERIIISSASDYNRLNDVLIQVSLATNGDILVLNTIDGGNDSILQHHADEIIYAYKRLHTGKID